MKKIFAYALMTGALASIIIGTYLLYTFFFKESLIQAIVCGIVCTLIMHLPQLPRSLKAARPKNFQPGTIVIMTIIFGASWWKPLEKGVFD